MKNLQTARKHAAEECMKFSKLALKAQSEVECAVPEYTLARERRIVADAQLERAREGKLGIDAVVAEVSQ